MSRPASERRPNRLQHETSPYLKQHALNPVDWYPWGDEALQQASTLDRPIFLSIGYSACHWCHVMEHESFEDHEIAELMNRHFINIKVDREERPDLDQIYMSAVQALTGHGGWPMSVFLMPDLKPFFGGTYWPPESRRGMPGFRDILQQIHDAWVTRRDQVERAANDLTNAVVQIGSPQEQPAKLGEEVLRKAMQSLLRSADRRHGGFGHAPKFPHPMDVRLLLRCAKRFGSTEALEVVRLTLDKMAMGGIYDHLGGGFHRYATDARWLVPHFEKMLYDNALLVPAYVEAWQVTGEEDYLRVVRETLDYVLREMTQPQGGFYSTQDADSEGEEGKFFVWLEQEIDEVLGPEEARVFNYCYDVTQEGNWEGRNILNRVKTNAQAAAMLKIDPEELEEVLARSRQKLFEARSERVWPGRDDKVLASWNGMMIAAMCRGAQALSQPKYAEAARAAADFLLEHMRAEDGRLWHGYKDGRARFNAYLDDYACVIDGLVELYQTVFDAKYIEAALELTGRMIEQFHDAERGSFFYTSADHEALIARNKDSQDSATPSGNSMAATALLKLARLVSRPDLEDKAVETLDMMSGQIERMPLAGGQALLALDFLVGPAREIVIADGPDDQENEEVLRSLHRHFVPNKVIARRTREMSDAALPKPLEPLLQGKSPQDGMTTVYLCEHGTCGLPVVGRTGLEAALA